MSEEMTAQQVAEYLGVSASTVRRLARRGDLPAAKVGGKWRFRRADVRKWLEAYERQVDEGLRLIAEERMADVAAGRSKLIPWEEAKAELGL